MDILAFDIEASNLSADFGIILTFGSKTVGKRGIEVLNILDYRDASGDLIKAEKRMLRDITTRMLDADCWLGHFSTWYDIPFINTRLLYHRMQTLPTKYPHIDTWKISKNHLKLRNNRLVTISGFLKTLEEKNAIQPEEWIRALGGHRPSMNYIVEHNRRDVVVLEEVYLLLRPLMTNHPNKGLLDGRGGCSTCGSKRVQYRGKYVTRTRAYRRFHCQDCGTWSHETKPIQIATLA